MGYQPRLRESRASYDRGMLRALLAVSILAAALGGAAQAAEVARSTLIVPPNRIGGVRLQESRARVDAALGRATGVRVVRSSSPRVISVDYPEAGLTAIYSIVAGTPRVAALITGDPRYATRSGVHVGSTLAATRRAPGMRCFNGGATCQQGLAYEKPGVVYSLIAGRVTRIAVVAVAD
jgi:hypothetical protein